MIDTAIILAGGLGTRLRPLTDNTPKPLLPIKGKPILQHILENLKRNGILNIIISLGYKSEKVMDYFKDGSWLGLRISYTLENLPLGTGGAIKKAAENLKDPVFVVWGDNLCDIDYHKLYSSYQKYKKTVTMALVPREDVENFGVAKLEGDFIRSFLEKPKREDAPSNLINAGIIVLDPTKLQILPEGKSSIEYDFYEKLPSGEMIAYIHNGQWFPTDTMEKYDLASRKFNP